MNETDSRLNKAASTTENTGLLSGESGQLLQNIRESDMDIDAASAELPPERDETLESEDPIKQMTVQIRALTEELRLLRVQLSGSQKTMQGSNALAEHQPEQKTPPQNEVSELPDIRGKPQKTRRKKILDAIGNAVFYLVLVAIVVGAFVLRGGGDGRPTLIAGFSAFQILSSSMEDVYPKGSLIVSKAVDPTELEIGDDITFMISETSSVTHRIIGITEDYLGTGKPGFETQGTMNEKPDKDLVASVNIVGKVVFCSKLLGDILNYVKANWPVLLFAAVVIAALVVFLRWNAKRTDKEEKSDPKGKQASPSELAEAHYSAPKENSSRNDP